MDIKLIQIYKSYKGIPVLEDVNMTFRSGKITCIMGPSGIGKTSLINILMGLTKADKGKVEGIEGRRISAVFQEDALIDHWDAVKNIQLVCEPGLSNEAIKEEFAHLGLRDYNNKAVSQLSGGMSRRVAILRALMADGELIIMDEPFTALDEETKRIVIDYIKDKSKGKTVLIITHDKEDVESLGADRVMLK